VLPTSPPISGKGTGRDMVPVNRKAEAVDMGKPISDALKIEMPGAITASGFGRDDTAREMQHTIKAS
jgi:hypothetical protein